MEQYIPNYTLNNIILKNFEEIARMQGELSSLSSSVANELEIMALANVDAVHYSTKIEGNKLTLKQVTKVLTGNLKGFKQERNIKEVLNYSKVRSLLFEKADKGNILTGPLILEAHRLLEKSIVEGTLKGHFRDGQNVIRDSRTGSIVYLPPEYQEVPSLMKSLIAFIIDSRLKSISPLILAPIFHYRFVTIHPFLDGNGRMARLFTNFISYSSGYNVSKYAALEKQHEKDMGTYYRALRTLQGNNFYDIPKDINITSWLEYWLSCMKETYKEALKRVGNIESSFDTFDPALNRLSRALGLFKRHKTLNAAQYQTLMGLGRTQAVSDLNELVKKGQIKKIGGGRSTVYKII
ncbi:MAG: Fic family protein [Acidobacteria bacterium]|nr:Fic family protein [Acidobacteriota bacterium]MBU4307660.1 Fic family protein [Acidobacteriota bacterium]MBU4405396.1 Fic family protein [Acidobacteriota bacterium]MBU4408654.1 Fic family protein [Pseudomonadota bacterium]MCG2809842.1 Fic family protein [Candidatus Aminicenantes bacterium]